MNSTTTNYGVGMFFKVGEYNREFVLNTAQDVFGRFSMSFDEVDNVFEVIETEINSSGFIGIYYIIKKVKSLISDKVYVFTNVEGLPYHCIIEMKQELNKVKFKFTESSFKPNVMYTARVVDENGSEAHGTFVKDHKLSDDVFLVIEARNDNLMAFMNSRTKLSFYLKNQNFIDMKSLDFIKDEPIIKPMKFKFNAKSLSNFGVSKLSLAITSKSGYGHTYWTIDETLFNNEFEVVKVHDGKLSKFKLVGSGDVYTLSGYPFVMMNDLDIIDESEESKTGEFVYPSETLENPYEGYMIVIDDTGYSLQDQKRNVLATATSLNGIKDVSPVAKAIYEGLENVI